MNRITSWLKLFVGMTLLAVVAVIVCSFLILILPFRGLRIRTCNVAAHLIGPFLVWLGGCRTPVSGREHLDSRRPAIYVSNHASAVDIFITIGLAPTGTAGVAKKELLRIPFLGWIYFLSGHLWIDRGRSGRAVASMRKFAELVRRLRLSIYMFPEGTRSRDGRLQPFKKGIVHLAVQTGLPVVPVVIVGAHRSWEARTFTIHGVEMPVHIAPPIDTGHWSLDRIDEALEELHAHFRRVLPADQQPAPQGAA